MDNDDTAFVSALIMFHDWLRERLIAQEGADPLGDSADTVAEFVCDTLDPFAETLNGLLESFSGIFNV
ncbi:hypothetical protein [Mycobacterium sp. CnD-18-1]|uniref:hypothetical protein n=1 Tax=Mycobacterium sp. CnD-18-1 TaxID=2917744 RepID=UPI001EF36386|nr:hypothetical protein [Mycobacterium sp. CnD-18-1]MCG7607097.1 hypothetical protein [Mycobacterium sp. CnD-18-1]